MPGLFISVNGWSVEAEDSEGVDEITRRAIHIPLPAKRAVLAMRRYTNLVKPIGWPWGWPLFESVVIIFSRMGARQKPRRQRTST